MYQPHYFITDKLVNQLSEIAEIRALVNKSILLPEREMFLRRAAAVKMAHTSTSIEGNELEEYQVAQVAQGKPVLAEQQQITEVKNYLSALRQIDAWAESNQSFSLQDILSVHKTVIEGLVEPQKTGVFRPGPVYIVNILPNQEEQLAYTPPNSKDVPQLIKDLLSWLLQANDIHPVIRAGLFHYQFETIHPFTDGNGRTGRLLTLLHLYQSGWDFKKVLVLEDYYNRNRKAYYEALQTGSTYPQRQKVDLSHWLEYFVTGFLDEAQQVRDQVLSLSVIGDISTTRNVLDKDELLIVDFALNLGQITSSDVVDILEVPKRTAQSKLKRLEDIRVLEKRGAGPATYYVVPKMNRV
jgi:Fic family protein